MGKIVKALQYLAGDLWIVGIVIGAYLLLLMIHDTQWMQAPIDNLVWLIAGK
jgi:hypothetical protein